MKTEMLRTRFVGGRLHNQHILVDTSKDEIDVPKEESFITAGCDTYVKYEMEHNGSIEYWLTGLDPSEDVAGFKFLYQTDHSVPMFYIMVNFVAELKLLSLKWKK